ncbi:MAG TPA: GNAT family N-acetyltransferase [Alphaproteobacteria bacterium]|nr:GNAT family N-acetyltransferase [Alphaproteobacteria bacterium]
MNCRARICRFSIVLDLDIRPAQADDLAALEWLGLFERDRHLIRSAFGAQERGDALLLLAIAGGFPLAQVWIDFARKPGTAVFWAVRTFPPLEGRGIGSRMLAAAEAEVRRRRLDRAELEVERDNTRARRFYQRRGWRLVADAQAQPTGPELLVMAKAL